MKTKQKILLILCTILLLVVSLKVISSFIFPNDFGFFINLITEILGAIITFVAIDSIITSNENRLKNEYKKIAYRTLYNPLKDYVFMWLHIGFESEEKAKLELKSQTLKELFFSDSFIENIKSKDFDEPFNKMFFLGQEDTRILKNIVPKLFTDFKHKLNISIEKYSIYFEPETLFLLEHFAEKSHLYEVFDFWISLNGGNHSKWFHSEKLKKEYLHQHFSKLFELIDKYNTICPNQYLINKETILSFKKLDDNVEY